jgi:hypothetical protein
MKRRCVDALFVSCDGLMKMDLEEGEKWIWEQGMEPPGIDEEGFGGNAVVEEAQIEEGVVWDGWQQLTPSLASRVLPLTDEEITSRARAARASIQARVDDGHFSRPRNLDPHSSSYLQDRPRYYHKYSPPDLPPTPEADTVPAVDSWHRCFPVLHLSNLPRGFSNVQVRKELDSFGTIRRVDMKEQSGGVTEAYVEFSGPGDVGEIVAKALEKEQWAATLFGDKVQPVRRLCRDGKECKAAWDGAWVPASSSPETSPSSQWFGTIPDEFLPDDPARSLSPITSDVTPEDVYSTFPRIFRVKFHFLDPRTTPVDVYRQLNSPDGLNIHKLAFRNIGVIGTGKRFVHACVDLTHFESATRLLHTYRPGERHFTPCPIASNNPGFCVTQIPCARLVISQFPPTRTPRPSDLRTLVKNLHTVAGGGMSRFLVVRGQQVLVVHVNDVQQAWKYLQTNTPKLKWELLQELGQLVTTVDVRPSTHVDEPMDLESDSDDEVQILTPLVKRKREEGVGLGIEGVKMARVEDWVSKDPRTRPV